MKEHPRIPQRLAAPLKILAHKFTYLGLVIGAFGLMLLGKADVVLVEKIRTQVTEAAAPILGVLTRPVETVSGIIEQAHKLSVIHEDNERLRQERDRLLQWQAAARHLEAENKALKGLLNFSPGPRISFITARIIADTGGAFAHSLIVNSGTRAGVQRGQAVMTGEGLAGRIVSAGRMSSRVLLLTDLNSRIPVLVESSRVRAVLAGDNSEQPKLIHLPPGVTVVPGDRIVTSGHGGVFPPGVPIGVIATVSDGGISILPYVTRERIEYVRIVNYKLEGLVPAPQTRERK
ncbi:MAG: rod shape-determining protein MreC [Rhodospirillales bacterium]|nr:rod shape-determining protein MreC [Rhodospirillales bacterium]